VIARARLGAATALLAAMCTASCAREREAAPAAPQPPLAACELLTFEIADPGGGEGLRRARSEMDMSTGDTFAKCLYSTEELPPRSVALELRRFPSEEKAKSQQRATVGYLPRLSGAEVEPVPGVGAEAAWVAGRLNQLHARAGTLRLIVTYETGVPVERKERAIAIARHALAPAVPSPP
jgi:hypothetical protein